MSEQTYKVLEVNGTNEWNSNRGGPMIDYRCTFEGVEGDVEVTRKKTTSAVQSGQELIGTLEPKTQAGYSHKFRSAQGGGGGNYSNGQRPRDPAERMSIERQVAAKCATDLLVGFMATGWVPESVNKLADQHKSLASQIAAEIAA